MPKKSKKMQIALKTLDIKKDYSVEEAIRLAKRTSFSKFDASVEVVYNLNIDSKKVDQQIRGSVILPNGTGKKKTILVFAKGNKLKEAELAGADFFGDISLIEKVQSGWLDFDIIIATPDLMPEVSQLGRILGPKGLMPNPKNGTVTMDIQKSIDEIRLGKINYRTDKGGNIHIPIGRVSFTEEKLLDNLKKVHENLLKAKPSSMKGTYIKKTIITTTFGPGIRINLLSF